ncbi:MAG TPA: DMT family transporter, partial [Burkholderiales bacterium]|nr:DMT family transporter [Burkholderiales bacterium]
MERAARLPVSPYVLLTLTALFWAGNWVIARSLQGIMSPIAMAFWRWFSALVLLLPFIARALVAERRAIVRHWKVLSVLALLGVGAFNALSYTGLRYTTASTGVLLNSVSPIIILAV